MGSSSIVVKFLMISLMESVEITDTGELSFICSDSIYLLVILKLSELPSCLKLSFESIIQFQIRRYPNMVARVLFPVPEVPERNINRGLAVVTVTLSLGVRTCASKISSELSKFFESLLNKLTSPKADEQSLLPYLNNYGVLQTSASLIYSGN